MLIKSIAATVAVVGLAAVGVCSSEGPAPSTATDAATTTAISTTSATPAAPPPEGLAVATFAGGCFWCMEPPYDKLDGVVSTTSGYAGGTETNPTYSAVSSGRTSHTETVRVVYDPARIDYARLVEVFWRNVDPLTANRQFCDRGRQYRTAIFFHDAEQERLARETKAEVERRLGATVVTEIEPAGPFWPAEEYHQDFYEKNPARYKSYRNGCGRDARLRELWGDEAGGG